MNKVLVELWDYDEDKKGKPSENFPHGPRVVQEELFDNFKEAWQYIINIETGRLEEYNKGRRNILYFQYTIYELSKVIERVFTRIKGD